MSNVEDFPEIHKIVLQYIERFNTAPTNATQFIKWSKTNGFGDVKYADANKYLKIQRESNDSMNKSSNLLIPNNESRSRPQSMGFTPSISSSQKSSPNLQSLSIPSSTPDHSSLLSHDYKKNVNNFKLDNSLSDASNFIISDNIDDLETRSNHSSNINYEIHIPMKPWLKHKPDWPNKTLSENDPKLQELTKWLQENNFEQFIDKLYDVGIETLEDLMKLNNEEEIKELTGYNGINMGVIYRRNFINCVLQLQQQQSTIINHDSKDLKTDDHDETNHNNNNNNNNHPHHPIDVTLSPNVSPNLTSHNMPNHNNNNNNNNTRRNSLKMSKDEERSVTQLAQQIRLQTQQLQSCKHNVSNLKKQFDQCKTNLNSTFDQAMNSLISRRQQLENAFEKAEMETIGKLENRIQELTKFAQILLTCKGQVEIKLKNTNQGVERDQYIINEVNKVLENIPKDDIPQYNVVFHQDNISLINSIENYGCIAVGKRRAKSPLPPAEESS